MAADATARGLDKVLRAVQGRVGKAGGVRAAARVLGCSPTLLSRVLHGHEAPPPKLLAAVGFSRVTVYEEA